MTIEAKTTAPATTPVVPAVANEAVAKFGTLPVAAVSSIFPEFVPAMPLPAFSAPTAFVPSVRAEHVLPRWIHEVFLPWLGLRTGTPILVTGPTGCGKTSSIRQAAARLNLPVYECTAHSRLEFNELVGHVTVQDGTMSFQYGPLSLAMKNGGLFLINEVDLLDPSTAAGLNSILDGSPLCIPENGGELVKPHKGFFFAATANSNGTGDATGMYTGVLMQNAAFMDRFIVVDAGYLAEDVEVSLLAKVCPSMPESIIQLMVKYANIVRAACGATNTNDTMNKTMSTRTLCQWVQWTDWFAGVKDLPNGVTASYRALEIVFLGACDDSDKTTAKELYQRIFG